MNAEYVCDCWKVTVEVNSNRQSSDKVDEANEDCLI